MTFVFSWPIVSFGAPAGGFAAAVGVTWFDAADAAPAPTALFAMTVNVTGRPAARPVIVSAVRASGVVTRWPLEATIV